MQTGMTENLNDFQKVMFVIFLVILARVKPFCATNIMQKCGAFIAFYTKRTIGYNLKH